jgi:fumarylacetoacetase
MKLNETHDPARRSWVTSANDTSSDFPIQNLPLGIFSEDARSVPRVGMAIGDQILDLTAAHELGLLPKSVPVEAVRSQSLNLLFVLGQLTLHDLRKAAGALLDSGPSGDIARMQAASLLKAQTSCQLHRPTAPSNYTDFYAGIHHARAAGAQLTPEDPLPANYKWVPIAYHGRASSVQISGAEVYRPIGQQPPKHPGAAPEFGPCETLDLELEMGFYIAAGNRQGTSIPIDRAADHIAGFSLLNDWSARDVQRWEMFPLGPFLSKSFATSVSAWVVTAEALLPFRAPALQRPDGDPTPLPYLFNRQDQTDGGIDVALRVLLSTSKMRAAVEEPVEIIVSNARYLYWTPAQMVAHHTINGCNLVPGDLIGTGTISGPTDAELGSMLELTVGGTRPVTLPNGERRTFLLDGDQITLLGRCERAGFIPIGFGACSSTIVGVQEAEAENESREDVDRFTDKSEVVYTVDGDPGGAPPPADRSLVSRF